MQNFNEQQLKDAIKKRLIDGSMTQEQARQAVDAFRGQVTQPQEVNQPAPQQAQQPTLNAGFQDLGVTPEGLAPDPYVNNAPSLADKIGNLFTGNLQKTPEMEGMAHLGQTGSIPKIMGDMSKADQAKFAALNLMSFNPDEVAKIASSMNPDISVIYNKDAQGGVYPILTNQKTGQTMMVNDPSLDMGDLGKFAGVGAIFTPAGLLANTGKTLGKKALVAGVASSATQSAIEGGQVAGGGEFNPDEVAMAGAGGAIGEVLPIAAGAIFRKFKGANSVDDIVSGLSPDQKARVESLKQGYNAKKGELTSLEKLEQMKQALASGDEARVAAMIGVDDEYLKAMKELGLQEKGLTSAATNDIQIQQLEQGLKKIPASESSAKEAAQIAELGQKADDLILEFGGNLDKSEVSSNLLNKVKTNITQLGDKAETVYNKIRDSLPNNTKANMQNTGEYFQNEIADLAGDDSLLSPLEKQLLKMSESDNVTYRAIDKIRKKVGAKLNGTSTAYADEDTATLKKIYSLLSEDQEVVANEFGMGEAWSAGKELVKKRKALEDDSIKMFGKDLNENIMVKLGQATSKLSKSDYKKFFDTIESIPKRDRQQAIISSLNDAFTLGSRKENQLNVAGFADWYNGLSRNPKLKSAFYGYLPPQMSKQLDALGKVTNNVRNAMGQAPVGGQVLATPTFLDGIANKVGEKILSKLPGFIGDVVETGLDKGKTKGSENAIKVLSNPEFVASIKAYSQGQTQKAQALEKRLLQRNDAKEWLKTLTKQEQNLIIREGLINWIQSDEQDEQN